MGHSSQTHTPTNMQRFLLVAGLAVTATFMPQGNGAPDLLTMEMVALQTCDLNEDNGASWCEIQQCIEKNEELAANAHAAGYDPSLDLFNEMTGCNGLNPDGSCSEECILTMDMVLESLGNDGDDDGNDDDDDVEEDDDDAEDNDDDDDAIPSPPSPPSPPFF